MYRGVQGFGSGAGRWSPPNEKHSSAVDPCPNFSGGFVFPEDERVGLYDPDEEYGWDCDGGSFGEGELWELMDEGEEDE